MSKLSDMQIEMIEALEDRKDMTNLYMGYCPNCGIFCAGYQQVPCEFCGCDTAPVPEPKKDTA